jgi:uncharacterized protein (DUF4213/DUF364 family)
VPASRLYKTRLFIRLPGGNLRLASRPVIEEAGEKFRAIISERNLGDEVVQVKVNTLSVKQAIGSPVRQDYPLIEGREVMIEAQFQGSFGQAFTDRPADYTGPINEIIALDMSNNTNRAVFIATLNAVMAHLGMVTGVRHCHDEEPEECAEEMARHIFEESGRVKLGMIGLQPAILENMVKTFGADNVRCTDLNPKNVGTLKYGAEIWDGRTDTSRIIDWCELVLATSSTIVNNTFDVIREMASSQGKRLIIFGVTGAGVSVLLGLERLCFQPH